MSCYLGGERLTLEGRKARSHDDFRRARSRGPQVLRLRGETQRRPVAGPERSPSRPHLVEQARSPSLPLLVEQAVVCAEHWQLTTSSGLPSKALGTRGT